MCIALRSLLVHLVLATLVSLPVMMMPAICFGQDNVAVPNLVGKNAQTANKELRSAGLNAKFALGPAASARDQSYVVFRQNPSVGTSIPAGSPVELTIYDVAPDDAPLSAANSSLNPSIQTAQETTQNSVIAHSFRHGVATGTDLEHGRAARRLVVQRVSIESPANQHPFGPGWSDANHIVQTNFGTGNLWLWRGGDLVLSAKQDGDIYRGTGGTTVRQTDDGWQWTTGRGEILSLDSEGRAISLKNAFGRETRYRWDDSGRLTRVEQDEQNFLAYFYDEATKQVSRIEGPEGLVCRYEYDARNRLTAVTNARNVRVTYSYDRNGRLLQATDPFGGSVNLTTLHEELARAQEASRSKSQNAVDETRRNRDELALAEKRAVPVLPAQPEPEYIRNDRGLVVEKRHRSVVTRYYYDEVGRLVSVSSPAGNRSFTYDEFDRVLSVQNSAGPASSYQWSPLNHIQRVENSDGRWTSIRHDQHGRPTQWLSSSGRKVDATYGANGCYSQIHWSPDLISQVAYDAEGRLLKSSLSTGREVSAEYDPAGRLMQVSASTGERQSLKYNDEGLPVEWTIGPHQRSFEYEDGRLKEISDPLFGQRSISYERLSEGEISLTWDDLGTWTRRLNVWRDPVLFRRPSGQTWQFEYDSQTQLVRTTTPTDRVWRFSRDEAGRLTGIESPGGQRTELERSPQGNITRVVRNETTQREYLYDEKGRLRMTTSPLGLAGVITYDDVSRVREVVTPDGKATYSYNESGLVSELAGPDYKVEQEYHADGSLAGRRYHLSTDQKDVDLELKLPLDAFGRLGGLEFDGIPIRYGYDEYGRLDQIMLPDQSVILISRDAAGRAGDDLSFGNVVRLERQLDQLSRVIAQSATQPDGQSLFREEYTYDPAGNLTRIQAEQLIPIGEVDAARVEIRDLTYNGDDRLIRVAQDGQETSYDYSLNDDLREVSSASQPAHWELDNAGRPGMLDLDVVYDWDAAGNLASVLSMNTEVRNEFDAAGRLIRRTLAELGWSFGYLPNGDRLWQKGPSGNISYVYLPTGLVGWKEPDGVSWLLVTLPDNGLPLAACSSTGEVRYLIADRLGSIRRVCDESGQVITSCDYGPFGEVVAADGFSPLNMYAGMLCDEHGLNYARRRYYDPQLCRFTSLDPEFGKLRFTGSLNAYAYAANNPYRYRDTSGAAPESVEEEPVTADNFWMAGFQDWKQQEDRNSSAAERAARNRAIDDALTSEVKQAGQQALNDVLTEGGNLLGNLAASVGSLSPWSIDNVTAAGSALAANNSLPAVSPSTGQLPGSGDQGLDPIDPLLAAAPDDILSPNLNATTDSSAAPDDADSAVSATQNASGDAASDLTPSSPATSPSSINSGQGRTSQGNTNGAARSAGGTSTPATLGQFIDDVLLAGGDDGVLSGPAQTLVNRVVGGLMNREVKDFVPAAQGKNILQISDIVKRNVLNRRPTYDGIFPYPTNDELDQARKILETVLPNERKADELKKDLASRSRELSDIADRILGPQNPFGDLIGLDVSSGKSDLFKDLADAVRKLNQLIAKVESENSEFPIQDALHAANQAKSRICGWLEDGYDPANAEDLHREGDALLAKARSALAKANEFNAAASGIKPPAGASPPPSDARAAADNIRDQLRQQIQEVSDLASQAQSIVDFVKDSGNDRTRFDMLYQDVKNKNESYIELIDGEQDRNSTGYNRFEAAAGKLETLLGKYRHDPRTQPYLDAASRWRSKFVGDARAHTDQNSVKRIRLAHARLESVPENAGDLVKQAQDAVSRGENVLKQARGIRTRSLDDALAAAHQAWQLIREAQDCRNRILTGPATGPLTGNIQTAELLKALNPRAVRLRPRHSVSLVPGHPLSALGHPASIALHKEHAAGVAVPNVVGMSASDAFKRIKEAGLTPKLGRGQAAKGNTKPFHIYQQAPLPGTLAAKGGTVSITMAMDAPRVVSREPTTPVMKKPVNETPPTSKPEAKPPINSSLDGTYTFVGEFKLMASRFDWKQTDAGSAQVTFHLDGPEPSNLHKYGLPRTVTVTAKKAGNSYQIPQDNPLNKAMVTALIKFIDGIPVNAADAKAAQKANVKDIWSPSYTLTPNGKAFDLKVNSSVRASQDRAVRK
ncbi:MAG: PASTA domain-containing protein [Planctomycetota bacterium]|nr:PASTA domain-containing protein [Planctomycetota bacterium]